MVGDKRMTRAIIISVEYGDILELTLPYNREFFSEVLVVSVESDAKTLQVCADNDVAVHCTDAFYRKSAIFNKFAALEEGLDVLGRKDWMLVLDADILIPKRRPEFKPREGNLYTPHRRIWDPIPSEVPEERLWRTKRRTLANEEFAGYFQYFHADDPVLREQPWYQTDWTWAGGADSFFHQKWAASKKVRPPFEVLHLGPPFTNWAGRVTPFVDGTVHEKAEDRTGIREMLIKARRTSTRGGRFLKEKIR
jgi:hypothetical protein